MRLNALLYAWAKDNPNAEITPELINRLRYLSGTADSMNVTGGWLTDRVYEDPEVISLIKLIQKDPVKANNIFASQGFNNESAIQNYFEWATQFMNGCTNRASILRNLWGRDFNKNLRLASRYLQDNLVVAINDYNYGKSKEQIEKESRLAEAKKQLDAEEATKKEYEMHRQNFIRAGLGDPDEPSPSLIPDEWL